MARGDMAVWKFLIIGIAIFVMILVGMGFMVPDPDLPTVTNNTSAEYQQQEMIRETGSMLYSGWTYLGIGLFAVGIILAFMSYRKVWR